ncbi:T9SS type A sorting domain-containing protein [Bacteroidota bacterium]
MKTLLLSIVAIFFSINMFAQDFAPVGAEWYYTEMFAFSGDVNFVKLTAEKDTLINGETFRKIIKNHRFICLERPEVEFLLNKSDTVFFLDTNMIDLHILYIFNAKISDSWVIEIMDEEKELDTIRITVDSISTMHINGADLKAMHVTYEKIDENWPATYQSVIVEKMGDILYLFNWSPLTHTACDGNYPVGLRCYQDAEIGLYSNGKYDSCTYTYDWIGIEEPKSGEVISLFPNPSNGIVQIHVKSAKLLTFELHDIMGRLIHSGSFTKTTQLDFTNMQKGVYFISVRQDDQLLERVKILTY